MRYFLLYTLPSGAVMMKTGEAADDEAALRRFFERRAPIGAELWRIPPGQATIGRSDDPDDRMGVVEECDGSCDHGVRCRRHWFIDSDIFRRECAP